MNFLLNVTLCLCFRHFFCQSVTQSPTVVTRNECQSLTITCKFRPDQQKYNHFVTGHFFKYTQQRTDWERIYTGGRYSITENKAEMTVTLKITNLVVMDSATYFCKVEYKYTQSFTVNYDTRYLDGTGSKVTVTVDPLSLVSQSPPLQSSNSEDDVTLSCKYFGFCTYTVHWFRQFKAKPPKLLLQGHTSGEQDQENATERHFFSSLDREQKISKLLISKLQVSDSALYQCAISRRGAQ
ncbi:uncharacterized protein LOC134352442 [Mobula hypostoma]|uniref:uncharacterized protein LOC134352442 n=1 Tax=Mobula hypostoma TaxID=723540 RepID=UPI002FC3B4E7